MALLGLVFMAMPSLFMALTKLLLATPSWVSMVLPYIFMVLATLLPATPRWVFVALPLHLRWGAAKAAGMTHLHHLIDSCLPTLFTALTWLDTALCVALLTVNPRPCTLLPALAWLDTALCVALPAGTPGNVLRQPHSFPMLLDLLRIAPVGVAIDGAALSDS